MLFPMSIELKNIDSMIFDFDYTLVDSSPVILEGISYALGKMGLPIPTPELMRKTIGLTSKDALKVLIGTNDRKAVAEFEVLFIRREGEVTFERTIFLEGAKQVLKELDGRGLGLGIVSNRSHKMIDEFLRREKISELVDVIVGVEDAPKPKPDPSGLMMALNKLAGSKTRTFYIGDSRVDAKTAHRVGIPFIAVLSGMTPKQDFKKYSPCFIVNKLTEILQLFNQ
jgi:phosphoglycolate phosphatase